MGLKDGLASLELNATTVSGGTVLADTLTAGGAEVGTAEISSGAVTAVNLATGAVMNYALSGGQCSGTVIADRIVNSSITNLQMATNGATGTTVGLEFATIKTGSPSVGGNALQFGTGDTSAGSILWVVFGTAFKAAPSIALTTIGATANGTSVIGSPVVVGSFLAVSEVASQPFHWIAAGSGRV